MDLNYNHDEIDWSNMHNKIIPKEKLVSLEQFYRLNIVEKKNSINSRVPDEKESENFDNDDKKLDGSLKNQNFEPILGNKQSNLRLNHFKFFNNSKLTNNIKKKQDQINQILPNNKTSVSSNNRDGQKIALALQNHNLTFDASNNLQMTETKQSRHKKLRNKVFSIQTEFQNDEEARIQKQPNAQKLTYLKRYVANFGKSGNSQFCDGFWGNNVNLETPTRNNYSNTPSTNANNSGLSINNDKSTPPNTFGNYLPFNPNQASLNPSLKERELSIIDLQLPIKTNLSHSGAFVSHFQQNQLKQKKNTNQNSSQSNELSEHNFNDDLFLFFSKNKNSSFKNPNSNSSILLDNLDLTSIMSKTKNESNDLRSYNEARILDSVMPVLSDQIKISSIDRSNTFLSKYLVNQKKKKLNSLNNTNNKIYENSLNKFSKSNFSNGNNLTNFLTKNESQEPIVTTSLNNISTNSLLIKRLNF